MYVFQVESADYSHWNSDFKAGFPGDWGFGGEKQTTFRDELSIRAKDRAP